MSVLNCCSSYALFSQVYYWKQHKHNPHHMEKHILNFNGNHSRGMLPGLHPFSLYSFNVRVYNGKGEGPPSPNQQFETPEGGEDAREPVQGRDCRHFCLAGEASQLNKVKL